ncbi:hypothetical protein [Rathayibacter sp. VKM Ac-2801]|uniref:hypothetical protein n=1 Tax=Rathayibacter sp. VKM Ac-2801 TaxID=2609255 RepID=UPI00131FBC04|nr:hypothetical protein [Rathayibacter sp. VKM Ac-2801]QHC71834.1 hypothetical protein GSU45_16520 [Rathayibacter sp. VKM Ac-2801]
MVLDEESTPSAPRPRRRRAAVVAGAVVLAVAAVAAVGGFADVPEEDQPVLRLGETFSNELYSVTVESVEIADADPLAPTPDGTLAVVARATLLHSGDEPARSPEDWLRPLDLDLSPLALSLVSARDGSIAPPIQPGLPVEVFYIWRLAEGADAASGDPVRLGVYERYVDTTGPIDGARTAPVLVGVVDGEQ